MKYEVDMLIKNEWYPIIEDESIDNVDTILLVLKTTHPDHQIRILEDDRVIVFLHGLKTNYDYWQENFIKNNENSIYQRIKGARNNQKL